MKILDIFEEIYAAISGNKVRSGLTILGIVIGISSVIVMVAVGQGAQNTIEANIQSIGSNLLIVMPGAQRGAGVTVSAGRGSARSLKTDDAEAIKNQISFLKGVAPELTGRYQVTAPGKNTNTQIVATTPDYPAVRNVEINEGSFIAEQNVRSSAKVAVLGPTVRDDLFGENASSIGKTIRINKVDFKVIGITKAKGGSGFNNPDDVIFIPLTTGQRFLAGDDYLSTISISGNTPQDLTAIQEQVTELLLTRHHISDPTLADFNILNQTDIVAAASSVTQTLTVLLAAIAGISLVVGGIGIMNMMLTTVTERTREIGLRKAIGAKSRDINLQFLLEAIVLTFSGGVMGVLFGWGVSSIIASLGLMPTKISIFSILLAFGVSALIGIVFGYYPARRASKLNPIEALRYE